ncbi:MAG: queuine tRNA-ribosyltransferase, partial [Actinomycetota bacterium]
IQVGEPSAARLLTIHNLAWLLGLMGQTRDAICAGTFDALRAEVVDIWNVGTLN